MGPSDLRVGSTLKVHGRQFFIHAADDFTKAWCMVRARARPRNPPRCAAPAALGASRAHEAAMWGSSTAQSPPAACPLPLAA